MLKHAFKSIFYIGMFASVLVAPCSFGAKRPGGLVMECEFLLIDSASSRFARKWLNDALSSIVNNEPVFLGYSPQPEAYVALGLPAMFPKHTTMRIELPKAGSNLHAYWIRVIDKKGEEIVAIPFHVPPLVVWKTVQGWGENAEVEVQKDIRKEDQKVISVGAPLGDFANGRKFFVIRRRMANLVTVAVGIDVPLEDYRTYTQAKNPALVLVDDNKILSRVEVIKAHFRIPWFPNHRNPLSDSQSTH